MKYYIPKKYTVSDSSIPLYSDTNGVVYPQWTENTPFLKDTIVAHKGCLYSAYTNIYPLATYSWNDLSNQTTAQVIKLSDNTIITPTVVPCVKDQTVVYVIDTWKAGRENVIGKYFIFRGTTGNIDFTIVDPLNPSTFHFEEINNYTNIKTEPIEGETTIYWKYLERQNRNKINDGAYNSQSIAKNSTEAWWEFEASSPDRVILFNIAAQQAKITVYKDDINNPVYENTQTDLVDYSSIINWRTLVRFREPIYRSLVYWDFPFLAGTYKVRITLTSSNEMDLKLGEVAYGSVSDLGITIDGIPTEVASAATVVEKENGEIVFEDEGNIAKIYLIYSFTVYYKSTIYDDIIKKCAELISQRVVVVGDDEDEQYQNLTVYGYVMEASPTLVTASEYSEIKIQVRRLL